VNFFHKFYATIQGYKRYSGYGFQVTVVPFADFQNTGKISPGGCARDAHWPRYQGLAVQAVSGASDVFHEKASQDVRLTGNRFP